MNLVVATANAGKAREFREMLGDSRFAWSDLASHREIPVVEETGATFRANACLKASYYAKTLNSWALADDSGRIIQQVFFYGTAKQLRILRNKTQLHAQFT